MRFRLTGINNQNFIMQDDGTGSWWQQVTGRAIAGPLRGKRLTLVPHDEVTFGTWKADHPGGRVLKPDATVEARDDYAPLDWERRMAKTRVVTTLPKKSPFTARTLVVGITVSGRSKAYPLEALRASRVLLDVVGDVPLMLAIGEDGRSVRVFDRRIDGRGHEFVATPSARLSLTDIETISERPRDLGPARRPHARTDRVPAGVLVRLADVPACNGGLQAVATRRAHAGSPGGSAPMRGTRNSSDSECRMGA